ncbi:carboxypeptidase-like regulatory domain-containing protein [Hymenobacter aerophilus]|uniref:carboxypeptidase-like regulatory domain-containing protein n=1 Tax=Hymenobacter aerophilus TaxID=119644 RepID=UPI0003711323|nr:carboxypeptidase-like regulatory domain-containing protein [Hymenobacter aerophilus]
MSLPFRPLLAATLLVAAAQPLYAQRTLTGTVQDPQGAAVPFAVLELPAQKLGVQADDEGRFSLPLPAGLTPTDSLTVSALGYARRRVPVPAAATVALRLAALPVSLNEVVVRGTRAAPTVAGAQQVNEAFSYSQSALSKEKNTGWQIAYRIDSPPAGYLEAVKFFIKKRGLGNCKEGYQAPFRLRIYGLDSLNSLPGPDLLLTSVVSAASKPGWHTIDVRQFNIPVPAKGFYVAMEWIYTDDQFLCNYQTHVEGARKATTRTSYGQMLAGAHSSGHTYSHSAGRGWRKSSGADAAIQVLIQP